MHTRAKVRHQQKFFDARGQIFERHHIARQAHTLAQDQRVDGCVVPHRAHFFQRFFGLGVVVLECVQVQCLEVFVGVPTRRNQLLPANGACLAGHAGTGRRGVGRQGGLDLRHGLAHTLRLRSRGPQQRHQQASLPRPCDLFHP